MASRANRNQREGSTARPQRAEVAPPQLPLDSFQQESLTGIVLEDFNVSKQAKLQRKFGRNQHTGEDLSFDSWMKLLTDMYFGHREPKTLPWKHSSNRSMMIAMAVLEVLHARLFPGIYNEELTQFRPTEKMDEKKVERINALMFWWIRVRSKLREFFDRWTRYAIGYGTVVSETQWTVDIRDKGQTSKFTDMEGIEQSEKVFDTFEQTRSDIYTLDDVFWQDGATDIQKDPIIFRMKLLYRDLEEMERNGEAVNITRPITKDGDTLKSLLPVNVAIPQNADQSTIDRLRDIKRRNIPVEVLKWYGNYDLDGDGHPEGIRILVNEQYKLYLGGVPITSLSGRGLRPLDITNFMPRLNEPQGIFGIGVLEQIKEHALEIDAIFNQMTDGNSLSVLKPGFYDPHGDLDAAAIKPMPGRLHPISNPQDSIFFPDFNIATEKLVLAIRLVLEFIERLTAASAFVMGKESDTVGGSGTATRVSTIVSSANQRHAVPLQRLREGAARIITHHLDQVQLNIPPGMENRIIGEEGVPIFQEGDLTAESLSGELDAYLLPDESLGSKETERELAQLIWQAAVGNPIIMTDPVKIWHSAAPMYRSVGKDPEKFLGPEPDISVLTSPEDEHTLMIQGDFAQIQATITQNHIEHLLSHQAFIQDPRLNDQNITPPTLRDQLLQFMQQHIQQHTQLMQVALSATKSGGNNGSPSGSPPGGPGGSPASNAPVGSEPGMGSAQDPFTKVRQTQRVGESQSPSGRGF